MCIRDRLSVELAAGPGVAAALDDVEDDVGVLRAVIGSPHNVVFDPVIDEVVLTAVADGPFVNRLRIALALQVRLWHVGDVGVAAE